MTSSTASSTPLNALDRIRPDVRAMHAYRVQPSAGMLKMDAMENPFRLPAHLQAALGQRLGALALNRYPGERVVELQAALARYAGMPEGCAIVLGNGSDELITLLALACAQPGTGQRATMLAPMPGFVMYPMSAQLQGLDFVGVPLTADFELDEPAMLAAIGQHKPAITYIAYPNNPTATLWYEGAVQRIIDAAGAQGGIVVMDEAYQPFASRTFIDRMRAEPARNAHVLLMRTLSKFGLAGVRLGYLIGPSALVGEIDKVRPPYNVNLLTAECALFALEHEGEFARQAQAICAERERLLVELATLPQTTVFPSLANMILLRVSASVGGSAAVFAALKAQGVLVKNVAAMHPLLANCLRLTVGTPEENDKLLAALRLVLV